MPAGTREAWIERVENLLGEMVTELGSGEGPLPIEDVRHYHKRAKCLLDWHGQLREEEIENEVSRLVSTAPTPGCQVCRETVCGYCLADRRTEVRQRLLKRES